jgi:stringent starvation protein B
MQEMTPNQPYLLRAFYDWIIDNDLTPYMVIDVNYPNVQVPTKFINNGQIVLNLSPSACVNFKMDLEYIEFQARFSGQPMNVSFPVASVSAVYAKENGAGTAFTVPEPPENVEVLEEKPIVKKSPLSPVKSVDSNQGKGDDDNEPPTRPTNKPGLRIVK